MNRMEPVFVGADVSKDRLDVHVRPGGEAFVVSRDGKGLEELVERLRLLSPALVAVEATGGFEMIVAKAIAGAELPLAVVNPAQIRHFAQAVGKRAKTDPIDAGVIAHFAQAVRPASRTLPDEASRLLAELVGGRRQVIEMIVAERHREKRATHTRVRKSLVRHIAVLEKELNTIDQDIDTLVRGSPVAGQRSSAGLGTRYRPNARQRFAGRLAGTGNARPARDCKLGGTCSVHPSIRALARQEHDRWWTQHRPRGHLHGGTRRQSP
jgi:transposase